jgi:hypothetical protein
MIANPIKRSIEMPEIKSFQTGKPFTVPVPDGMEITEIHPVNVLSEIEAEGKQYEIHVCPLDASSVVCVLEKKKPARGSSSRNPGAKRSGAGGSV